MNGNKDDQLREGGNVDIIHELTTALPLSSNTFVRQVLIGGQLKNTEVARIRNT